MELNVYPNWRAAVTAVGDLATVRSFEVTDLDKSFGNQPVRLWTMEEHGSATLGRLMDEMQTWNSKARVQTLNVSGHYIGLLSVKS